MLKPQLSTRCLLYFSKLMNFHDAVCIHSMSWRGSEVYSVINYGFEVLGAGSYFFFFLAK